MNEKAEGRDAGRVEPGEGWRLLVKDELTRQGDEVWRCGIGPWESLEYIYFGQPWDPYHWQIIRRRIQEDQPEQQGREDEEEFAQRLAARIKAYAKIRMEFGVKNGCGLEMNEDTLARMIREEMGQSEQA